MDEYSLPNVPKRIIENFLNLDSIIINDDYEYSKMTSAEQYIYEGIDRDFEGDNE